MIGIALDEKKEKFLLKIDLDKEFKSHINFIKTMLVARWYNAIDQIWEIPICHQNIKTMKSFISKFANQEILDEVIIPPYIKIERNSFNYYISFVYDPHIVDLIKSLMRYPKDKGYDKNTKEWIVSEDTFEALKNKLVNYAFEIGEDILIPGGELPSDIVEKTKEENRIKYVDLDAETLNGMIDMVKLQYPFLREYQTIDVVKYTTALGILNANQMGLGKTIETGAYIDLESPKQVLIVVPASLKIQWGKELVKFFPKLENKLYIINGTRTKRRKIWKEAFKKEEYVIITNYANLRTQDYIEFRLNHIEFDMLVFDEITKCKNRSTQTFKLAEKLCGLMKVGLTGTPIENHLKDIFNIMKIINPLFFGSWLNFATKYFVKGGYMGKEYIEKPNSAYKIAQELKEFDGWIRWDRKSVLKELPELLINTYRVQLSHEERQIYERLRLQLLEIYDKNGFKINLKNILSLILAMRRICSDPQIYDFNMKNSAKKKEFVRVIKDNMNGEKILVFSQFKDCVYLYAKALEEVGIKSMVITGDVPMKDRSDMIETFEDSEEIKVLLATDAFSYGQNLQMCSILINIDQHLNPAIIKQRIGRIQRIGQKNDTINVINFLVEDSIEEWVYEKIMQKNMLFDTVITSNEDKFNFTTAIKSYLEDSRNKEEIMDES